MKFIIFFIITICFATSVKAQEKSNAQLPPVRTTDPVPVQRQVSVELPVLKAANGTQQVASVALSLPMRKTDMSTMASATPFGSKVAKDKPAVQLPSSTSAPTDSTSRMPKKE